MTLAWLLARLGSPEDERVEEVERLKKSNFVLLTACDIKTVLKAQIMNELSIEIGELH